MQKDILTKTDAFIRNHPRLCSFLILIILSIIINVYWSIKGRPFYRDDDMLTYCNRLFMEGIFDALVIDVLPIFLISLLLAYFLKRMNSTKVLMPFYIKFIISFCISCLAMIIGGEQVMYFKITDVFFLILFSGIFATYFALFSHVSRLSFIVQCSIISFLMGILHWLTRVLEHWGT